MDAQRPHHVGIVEKIAVGTEPGGMDARHRANIVEFIGIAGNSDSAQHLAGFVANELPTAFQKQRVVGKPLDRFHEQRFFPRLL